MSGHSKWSTIKHKKAATDARRSRVWTKIIREVTVAARMGGGDVRDNARLRLAVDKAHAANMPNDTIERAVKKGSGELAGVNYEDIVYEGYGTAGVAMLIEVTTDNRNRSVSDVRNILERFGGNLGAAGSVAWIFKKRGLITLPKAAATEDQLMDLAIEAGAEDVRDAGDVWEIETDPTALDAVKAGLIKVKLPVAHAEIAHIPSTRVHLEGRQAESMAKLMTALDDNDDVQNVYANFDMDADVMERLA